MEYGKDSDRVKSSTKNQKSKYSSMLRLWFHKSYDATKSFNNTYLYTAVQIYKQKATISNVSFVIELISPYLGPKRDDNNDSKES